MLISFEHVSKLYGTQKAVDDVSFTIDNGEFVFLVGPSGAGKTTILRLLLRDLIPSAGSIKIEDIDVSHLPHQQIPKLRRKIGMIFQDFKILVDRTVFENVAISLEITGKRTDEVQKKVTEVLHLVGLSAKNNLFPVQLSAGELQRTVIARAIVGGPKVLLADEPTGNLDPTTSWEILKILKEINKLGTTIIMATHNVDIVNSMKKRVITMNKGSIVKDQKEGKYN